MKNNNIFPALILALAFFFSVLLVVNAYNHRFDYKNTVTVKGMSSKNFTSDLIVWEGEFETSAFDLKEAFRKLKADRQEVMNFLKQKGVVDTELVLEAVDIQKLIDYVYDEKTDQSKSVFRGYKLSQRVKITSKDVEKIENVSREITELLDKGVYFISYQPNYYYTKLDQLKLEMIAQATENARTRALKITENSGAKLGDLIGAKLGVFQITGQYSNEDYTWGGVFNTTSKNKTATVTITLTFKIK